MARVRWGARFSPHVLVFVLTVGLFGWLLGRAGAYAVFLWYANSYRVVEFEMAEVSPNDGAPYFSGRFAGEAETALLTGERLGDDIVVSGTEQRFAPGRRVPVWHSAEAPNTIVMGLETNDVAVDAMPTLPGVLPFLAYLAAALATAWAGGRVTVLVADRWARTYGDPTMLRRHHR